MNFTSIVRCSPRRLPEFFVKTIIILMTACIALVACDDPAPHIEESQLTLQTVSGTVVFRERIGLTTESRLEIKLLDLSGSEASAVEIAKTDIDNPGQSPIDFAIDYDPDLIDEQHFYGVTVNVFDRDRLILVSETTNPVLTGGAGSYIRVYAVRVSQVN